MEQGLDFDIEQHARLSLGDRVSARADLSACIWQVTEPEATSVMMASMSSLMPKECASSEI